MNRVHFRRWFRLLALAEGTTVVLLFCVAMPLKYALGDERIMPLAGFLHGVFFMLFLSALASAHRVEGWGWTRTSLWFVAALVPGGTLWGERRWLGATRPTHSLP